MLVALFGIMEIGDNLRALMINLITALSLSATFIISIRILLAAQAKTFTRQHRRATDNCDLEARQAAVAANPIHHNETTTHNS